MPIWVFDKFHIGKLLNKALDDICKAKKNNKELLKRYQSNFLWCKTNLRENKLEKLETLLLTYPDLWVKSASIKKISSAHFIIRQPKNRSSILNNGVKQSWTLRSPTCRNKIVATLKDSLVGNHHQLHFLQVLITVFLKVPIKGFNLPNSLLEVLPTLQILLTSHTPSAVNRNSITHTIRYRTRVCRPADQKILRNFMVDNSSK